MIFTTFNVAVIDAN